MVLVLFFFNPQLHKWTQEKATHFWSDGATKSRPWCISNFLPGFGCVYILHYRTVRRLKRILQCNRAFPVVFHCLNNLVKSIIQVVEEDTFFERLKYICSTQYRRRAFIRLIGFPIMRSNAKKLLVKFNRMTWLRWFCGVWCVWCPFVYLVSFFMQKNTFDGGWNSDMQLNDSFLCYHQYFFNDFVVQTVTKTQQWFTPL